jgi:thiol-disulfide isomerase/thioredoxin
MRELSHISFKSRRAVFTKSYQMKKIQTIFLSLIFVFSFSSYTKKDSLHKPETGSFAPAIMLSGEEKKLINFQENELTLVSFWASYDANSRINNRKFNRLAKEYQDIAFVSIALESHQSVFDATLKADGLNTENHYCENAASKLSDLYQLGKNGFGNFLVNRQGVIVAKNVSAENLQSLLAHR